MNLSALRQAANGGRSLHDRMAASHPDLVQGFVKCGTCGREKRVNSAKCLRSGWPKCCGATMRLMSAEGR